MSQQFALKHQRIDKKMNDLKLQREKAVNNRIKQLQSQAAALNRTQSSNLPDQLNDFRVKIKNLYKCIFQGTKEITIRKNDLLKEIKGQSLNENQY